jgi:hypothetical protein
MTGAEIQFYMTSSDEKDFANFLFSNFDVGIIRNALYETNEVEVYFDADLFLSLQPKMGNQNNPIWSIWFKDLGKYELSRYASLGKLYFKLVHNENPVIEFYRCVIKDSVLGPGRFAYLNTPYGSPRFSPDKVKQLTRKFEKLRRWVKKYGEKATWDGEKPTYNSYILPGAKQAFLNGIYLHSKGMQMTPPGFKPH